jgi:hypothetical protein
MNWACRQCKTIHSDIPFNGCHWCGHGAFEHAPAIADRSAIAPRRETGVARKGESGGAGTAIAQAPPPHPISRTT